MTGVNTAGNIRGVSNSHLLKFITMDDYISFAALIACFSMYNKIAKLGKAISYHKTDTR